MRAAWRASSLAGQPPASCCRCCCWAASHRSRSSGETGQPPAWSTGSVVVVRLSGRCTRGGRPCPGSRRRAVCGAAQRACRCLAPRTRRRGAGPPAGRCRLNEQLVRRVRKPRGGGHGRGSSGDALECTVDPETPARRWMGDNDRSAPTSGRVGVLRRRGGRQNSLRAPPAGSHWGEGNHHHAGLNYTAKFAEGCQLRPEAPRATRTEAHRPTTLHPSRQPPSPCGKVGEKGPTGSTHFTLSAGP